MTTSSSRTAFDRHRDFLKASSSLTIGFSMSSVAGSAGATTLRAPKSVVKETIQFLDHHQVRKPRHDLLWEGRSRYRRPGPRLRNWRPKSSTSPSTGSRW